MIFDTIGDKLVDQVDQAGVRPATKALCVYCPWYT